MPTQQDSTHARSIANLLRAAGVAESLGPRYAPTDPLISVDGIRTFCRDCSTTLEGSFSLERGYKDAGAARKPLFSKLGTFIGRIASTLKASKAPDSSVAAARALADDCRGTRAGKAPQPAASGASAEDIVGQISVAQTSFDSQVEHFRKSVRLCLDQRAYKATAPELEPDALRDRLARLDEANSTVSTAGIAYSQALIARDRLLYHPETGLVARMDALRTHFESAFGPTSAERRLLNGLIVRDRSNERLAAV